MGLGLSLNNFNKSKRSKYKKSLIDLPLDDDFEFSEPIFCDYQSELILDDADVVVVEKGRQIGFSHTFAFKAVLDCISDKRDFIYTSYNLQACKEFIKDCAKWCRVFNILFNTYEIEEIDENNFCIFEIKMNNLRSIFSVAGDAKNLRGKPGCAILIDEAAYRDYPLEDIMASAMATLIHGGKVIIGSTHCGLENDFNILCEDIRKGLKKYSLHKITFRDAIEQGLYKRICIKQNIKYSLEKEFEFVAKIYSMYGVRASEELDAIPGDFNQEGLIFTGLKKYLGDFNNSYDWVYFRYHDLAASSNKNETAYFSASVKVGLQLSTNIIVVVDYQAEQLLPLEGDAKIMNLAIFDGSQCTQIIEQEPGSSGIKYVEYMKNRLAQKGLYMVDGYAPKLNKITRAIPAANAAMQGDLLIIDSGWKDEFNKLLKRFSAKKQPLVNDVVDCLSGSFDYIKNGRSFLY